MRWSLGRHLDVAEMPGGYLKECVSSRLPTQGAPMLGPPPQWLGRPRNATGSRLPAAEPAPSQAPLGEGRDS